MPVKILAKYIFKNKIEAGVFTGLEGNQYHLNSVNNSELNKDYVVKISTVKAGLVLGFPLFKKMFLNVETGYTLYRRLEMFEEINNELVDKELENQFFVQAKIEYRMR